MRKPRSRSRRDSQAAASRATPTVVFACLLVLAGAWAYATSFGGVFVLDDIRAIVRNQTIHALQPLSLPLSPPPESTVSGRPIANLAFALNETFAPGNVRGYHALNLLIHLAAGLTLFGLVRRTLRTARLRARFGESASWLALAVAIVWLVHPLQTAAVTYVVQRVESLMGLFYLLTLYCAIRAADRAHAQSWTIAAIACCALGMATKEVMVTAPVVVWLWHRAFGEADRRPPPWLWAGLAATWAIVVALVWHEHRGPSIALGGGLVWRYLLTQAEVVTHYLQLSAWPSPLVFLYTWPLATSLGAVWPQAIVLVGLVIATVFAVMRRHPLGFAGAWFFVILAPTSSLLPIVTEVAAEHRMYLPLAAVVACAVIGGFVAGGALLARVVGEPRRRRQAGLAIGVCLIAVVIAGLGVTTRARNRDYWSAERLWGDAVRKQPRNARARVGYGEALAATGRFAEAVTQYAAAVDLAPADPIALVGLGTALAAQGQIDAAIPVLERALGLRPDDLDAHRALGLACATRREDARAVAHLERVVASETADAFLLGQLATLLADSRDASVRNGARAVELAERAVRATSRRDPTALEILAVAQASVERYREAAATAADALAIARARGQAALVDRLAYRITVYGALQQGRAPR